MRNTLKEYLIQNGITTNDKQRLQIGLKVIRICSATVIRKKEGEFKVRVYPMATLNNPKVHEIILNELNK